MSTNHVDTERLVAFLDHRLSPAVKEEVITHFAECSACRREMTAVRQLLKGRREKLMPWHVVTAVLVALAASIAFLVVPGVRRAGNESAGSVRSGAAITSSDQLRPITLTSPPEDAVLEGRALVFVWGAVGADATYRLTVQDSTGAAVWSTTVEDTSATLPDSVRLTPGAYYWSVAARLRDANSAKTSVRRFLAR